MTRYDQGLQPLWQTTKLHDVFFQLLAGAPGIVKASTLPGE